MPRMDHNPKSRVSFGCPEDVLDEFDDLCDDEGVSRSERLRVLVKQDVARHSDDDQESMALPAEDRLADAYLTLLDAAEPINDAGLRVSREEAMNRLYTNDTPKSAVMDSLIRPLKKQGFVNVDPSMSRVWIVVRPPE
ncbi:ribbon-helix-helix domain-containing protein [Haloplanus pelagicus]|uniref:ribbon-helix-helix domain-containing protein n=1 Tax=Haloplanus pelagicus TaxID=2949995 RepID=UPI002041C0AA|nr:ribbon-helix-helix domain-containing protein [Haloplanus sp. HW8-1]